MTIDNPSIPDETLAELERLEREAHESPWEIGSYQDITDEWIAYLKPLNLTLHDDTSDKFSSSINLVVALRNHAQSLIAGCRRAVELEDSTPIAPEWLRELGWEVDGESPWIARTHGLDLLGNGSLYVGTGTTRWPVPITTRGQLLRLLSVLKES